MPKKKQSPKINLYRNIAVTFIVFTLILVVTVFIFSYNQATIIVKASSQSIDLSFNVLVKESPSPEELADKDVLSGYLETIEVSDSGVFNVLSTKTVLNDKIVGEVKIINTSSRNQPLLQSTQLQDINGVIVRTNEYVMVPAKGDITVSVFAKDPDNFENIKPGKLTIIKLNQSSQKLIYGQNDEVLSDEPREVKVLAESDVNRAKEELQKKLTDDLKNKLGIRGDQDLNVEIIEYKIDKNVGDEANQFNLEMTIRASELKIDDNHLLSLIGRKVEGLDTSGLSVSALKTDNFSYSIIETNYDGGVLIKADYSLKVFLSEENPIIDVNNFTSKSSSDVKEYLDSQELIEEYQIFLSPYWSKKFPSNKEKIKIIVQ